MSPTEMAYRKTAIGGASGFGLLVALYDTLAGDLRRAANTVLPANMVPDRIEVVASMPLNRSNALDEVGLREMAGLRPFRA